jgi:hypothetical protein
METLYFSWMALKILGASWLIMIPLTLFEIYLPLDSRR